VHQTSKSVVLTLDITVRGDFLCNYRRCSLLCVSYYTLPPKSEVADIITTSSGGRPVGQCTARDIPTTDKRWQDAAENFEALQQRNSELASFLATFYERPRSLLLTRNQSMCHYNADTSLVTSVGAKK
jgi:hypothetical protein